jgi:hypothetical protein
MMQRFDSESRVLEKNHLPGALVRSLVQCLEIAIPSARIQWGADFSNAVIDPQGRNLRNQCESI